MGFESVRSFKTGVELKGTMQDCIRLNLNLRSAGQVLFSLAAYKTNTPDGLYEKLLTFPWENVLPAGGYFSISSNVQTPAVKNNLYANVRVKDAIVDRFRKLTGKRPDSGSSLNRAVIHLYWKEDKAELFADTSGETLSKHGYRKIPGKAPMLESLAAANILASRWDTVSPFINPMCGSSTLAIEAALLATNRVPGLYRSNYSFMHYVGYEHEMYMSERKKLDKNIIEANRLKIIATDISEDAIAISKINATNAGVVSLIDFSICDFASTIVPSGLPGVIFLNPEYGERLGEEKELEYTYARMGDFLKRKCQGYTGYVFTGNMELAKKIGLKPARRIEFYNGKIDCRLLEYELYAGTKREQK